MAAPEIRHDYAEVNGVRLHYAAAGAGDPIVFLHGFPEFWYAWHNQLEEFGRDHLAVAPDLRGYNLSSKPEGIDSYSTHLIAEDVRQLIEHLGAERATVVGHDWGGAPAWFLATFQTEAVERLVILNSPHPGPFARELAESSAQQEASAYMGVFRGEPGKAEEILLGNDFEGLRKFTEGLWPALSEEEQAAYREAWSQEGAIAAGLNWYRASPIALPGEEGFPFPVPEPEHFRTEVPTLVIWGERDTVLPPTLLDGLEDYVPNLTVKRVDATHWVVHEQPELVNRYIREFVESG
jgi:pimeloyl-ACP methyl ester carboxylesterase